MHEEELQAMRGQIAALTLTMTAVIQTIQALPAAQAALNLKISLEEEKQLDEENETPPSEVSARNSIAESYCDLLSAVAKNG